MRNTAGRAGALAAGLTAGCDKGDCGWLRNGVGWLFGDPRGVMAGAGTVELHGWVGRQIQFFRFSVGGWLRVKTMRTAAGGCFPQPGEETAPSREL